MHIVGVIPARYGSQRLPAKPLVDLLGKTMIQRVYEQVLKSALIREAIVATDDERIGEVVRASGGEVIMTSPGIRTGSDRVAEVARQREGDIFVNIQGDEPLIEPSMIDAAVALLLDDPAATVATLARRIERTDELLNPNVVKVVLSCAGYALYFSRSVIPHVRENLDRSTWLEHHTYYKHVGLYCFRRESLLRFAELPESGLERAERLEQLRLLEAGIDIKVGITEYDSVPVDTPEDVERVVGLLRLRQAVSL